MRRAVVALVLALACGIAVAGPPRPVIRAVASVGMTVAQLERSVAFYAEVLGFEKIAETEVSGEPYERLHGVAGLRLRVARMRLGEETLELVEYATPRGRPAPADARSNDRWFQHIAIVVSDMDAAYARLRHHHVVHVSPAPQRLPDWNVGAGGIRAFYFKDPDGHPLEVIWFPPGKGDPRWRHANGRLFLGIDHTAIVVGDTARSLACYRDTLGLGVAGTSENWGPEQERLNDVPGARLRITTLRASAGPGIEFLEYLEPRDGRASPADVRPNDLIHWHTTLVADDVAAATRALRGGACLPGALATAEPADRALGFARAVRARDPDGHALEIVER